MLNINLNTNWGTNWWAIQQAKNAKELAAKALIPKICDFCAVKIEEDDYYYIGFDRHRIYAATCTQRRCVQWLNWKIKRRKR